MFPHFRGRFKQNSLFNQHLVLYVTISTIPFRRSIIRRSRITTLKNMHKFFFITSPNFPGVILKNLCSNMFKSSNNPTHPQRCFFFPTALRRASGCGTLTFSAESSRIRSSNSSHGTQPDQRLPWHMALPREIREKINSPTISGLEVFVTRPLGLGVPY